MLTIGLKGTIEQKLEWIFNLYDIQKTGYIDKDDLQEVVRVGPESILDDSN